MFVRSMPTPSGRICCAQTLRGGKRSGCTLADRQQMPFANLAVGEGKDLLLRLQRVLVGEVVGSEQHGERIVDEVQLLQAEDRLAIGIEIVAVCVGDAVDGVSGLCDDLGVDDRPELLTEEIGEVDDEAFGAVELGDRDEDRRRVEGVAGDAREVQLIERVDHRGRRIGRAEILQAALLISRALGEGQSAPRRRNEGIDQQTGDGARAADLAQCGDVRDRANQVDKVVVRDDLELLVLANAAVGILIGKRAGVAGECGKCRAGFSDDIDIGRELQRGRRPQTYADGSGCRAAGDARVLDHAAERRDSDDVRHVAGRERLRGVVVFIAEGV